MRPDDSVPSHSNLPPGTRRSHRRRSTRSGVDTVCRLLRRLNGYASKDTGGVFDDMTQKFSGGLVPWYGQNGEE